jgi:hypothetical protein
MGESELMVARRDKVSRGLLTRESTLISETDQLRQAPAKKLGCCHATMCGRDSALTLTFPTRKAGVVTKLRAEDFRMR